VEPFILRVRLTPRAASSQIDGWDGDLLRVRVAAPPVEGKANRALLRLLAQALDVPPSRLRLVKGQTSREKVIAVEGVSGEDVRARLSGGKTREAGRQGSLLG
jgi:uncharacterized protein (TIGR00251 family)